MVDAADSPSAGGDTVRVQVSPLVLRAGSPPGNRLFSLRVTKFRRSRNQSRRHSGGSRPSPGALGRMSANNCQRRFFICPKRKVISPRRKVICRGRFGTCQKGKIICQRRFGNCPRSFAICQRSFYCCPKAEVICPRTKGSCRWATASYPILQVLRLQIRERHVLN